MQVLVPKINDEAGFGLTYESHIGQVWGWQGRVDCIRPASTRVFVMVEGARRWMAQLEAVRAGVGAEKQ